MTSASEFAHLCPGCLTDKGHTSICPHCGYDESLKRGPLVLPHRALLHGQYLIGKVLGKPGGFGITYLALDTKLETRVAIKEYLPRDLAGRDGDHATISAHSAEDGEFFRYGLTQFLQEARTLAKFDHANIVRVRNFFEENGTGYLVMDYYDGTTLADYLSHQPQGKLPEATAVGILMPILDGLREVHAKNFLHRDIKPQNIYLTTGNRPILLDFGAARQAMGERSRSMSVVLSEGYAPYEQYHSRGKQGPWTDIYACAAVLYHTVSGEAPPPATERMSQDELDISALGVSASLSEALRAGLAVDHHNRPQKMEAFQALLLGVRVPSTDVETQSKIEQAVQSATDVQSITDSSVSKNTSHKKAWWIAAWAAFAVVAMMTMFGNEKKVEVTAVDVLAIVEPLLVPLVPETISTGNVVSGVLEVEQTPSKSAKTERESLHESMATTTKQVEIKNSVVETYIIISGLYMLPAKISDECNIRYPSLGGLARITKDSYLKRNLALFEQTTRRFNLLIENNLDENEKNAFKMLLILSNKQFFEKTQHMLDSEQTCEAMLEKIGGKGMDLNVLAAEQLTAIND